jgi:hypothetical protein
VRHHALGLDVVFLVGLEVGMAEQVGRYADLFGRAVDQFGQGAVPKRVRPDCFAERLLGAGLDLMPDRRAVHRPTGSVVPKMVPLRCPSLALSRCNQCNEARCT